MFNLCINYSMVYGKVVSICSLYVLTILWYMERHRIQMFTLCINYSMGYGTVISRCSLYVLTILWYMERLYPDVHSIYLLLYGIWYMERWYPDVPSMYWLLYGIWKGGIQMFTLCIKYSMVYEKVVSRCSLYVLTILWDMKR